MSRAAIPLPPRDRQPTEQAPRLRVVGLPDEVREGPCRAAFRALRPHQWAKNTLLFVPLLLAHQMGDPVRWLAICTAFVLFSAVASAVYLFNDLIDLEADRRHPIKQYRPMAAGTLSVELAVLGMVGLAVGSMVVSSLVMPWSFTGLLTAYLVVTTAYTLHIKRTLILDVLVLAGLYSLRLFCGAVLAGIEVSPWLMSFSTFLFMSLALLKRYTELCRQDPASFHERRRSYVPEDANLLQSMGVISGYMSVLVLCLYISGSTVTRLYPNPTLLWLIAPILLYWISRMWILARRGTIAEDPLVAAVRDPRSYLAGGASAILVVASSVQI